MHKGRATVLMSGGIDSTACAHFLQHEEWAVDGIHIDFGQAAAAAEWNALKRVSLDLAVNVEKLKFQFQSAYGTGEILGRNALLIFSAVVAAQAQTQAIALGIHGGTPYFDCSEDFLKKISSLVQECTDGRMIVFAPFVKWTKAEVFAYVTRENIPIENTYSCEAGTVPPCEKCLSCKDRALLHVGKA